MQNAAAEVFFILRFLLKNKFVVTRVKFFVRIAEKNAAAKALGNIGVCAYSVTLAPPSDLDSRKLGRGVIDARGDNGSEEYLLCILKGRVLAKSRYVICKYPYDVAKEMVVAGGV